MKKRRGGRSTPNAEPKDFNSIATEDIEVQKKPFWHNSFGDRSSDYAEKTSSSEDSPQDNGSILKFILIAGAVTYLFTMTCAFVVFPLIYAKNVIQYSTIADPLNMNHPAFKFTTMVDIGSRWTPKNVFTTYRIFLLLPIVMLVLGIAFVYFNRKTQSENKLIIGTGVLAIPIVILAATFGVLKAASVLVRSDIRAINNVNFYIVTHFYNSTEFNVLSKPDVDRLQQIQTYQGLLNNILSSSSNDDGQEEDFAKALFTINLYLTFYEIGIRHKNVDDALRLFNTSSRLWSKNFADFLSPKTVFVQNRIGEILANVRDDENTRAMRMKAKSLANTWVNELNNRLGSISYASASTAFIVATIGLLIIYILPIKFFLQYMNK